MIQPTLFAPVEGPIAVNLKCPTCGHAWLSAIIDPLRDGKGASAASTAKRCYCPACHEKPPMQVQG